MKLQDYLNKIQEDSGPVWRPPPPVRHMHDPEEDEDYMEEAGFENYPKGWDRQSVIKFAKSLTDEYNVKPKEKGFFDACMKKMKDHMKDPEGFCAAVKDEAYNSTYWRGEDKSPAEVKKDVRTHKKIHKESVLQEYDEAYMIPICVCLKQKRMQLVCLKIARALCGANLTCQHRIDRQIDAITGNFNPSGEIN